MIRISTGRFIKNDLDCYMMFSVGICFPEKYVFLIYLIDMKQ